MRIQVIIATLNRPDTVASVVANLRRQTRVPNGIVVVGTNDSDLVEIDTRGGIPITLMTSEKGSCRQRNAGLDLVRDEADLVVFFDDDFVPHTGFLAKAVELFAADSRLMGATGMLIADGAKEEPVDFETAVRLTETYDVDLLKPDRPTEALYGCNMVIRMSAIRNKSFDENLPLYGWLEDIDFTYPLNKQGHMIRTRALTGVHMGSQKGKTSGKRLGYSQVANPFYLLRKGSVPRKLAYRLLRNNVLSNAARIVRPEPHIDRRGRFLGNMRALIDIALMRSRPQRVIDL